MKRDYTILRYHMRCTPGYEQAHAQVAGLLANYAFPTYSDYQAACNERGIIYYNEAVYDRFMHPQKQEVAV